MIIGSGFNVYPAEVEDSLSSHPAVLEVGVVGQPDARTGEAVVAFVKLKAPGATPTELVEHARRVLTAYKVPRLVIVREDLPKSPVGKILRFELSRILAGLGAAAPAA